MIYIGSETIKKTTETLRLRLQARKNEHEILFNSLKSDHSAQTVPLVSLK